MCNEYVQSCVCSVCFFRHNVLVKKVKISVLNWGRRHYIRQADGAVRSGPEIAHGGQTGAAPVPAADAARHAAPHQRKEFMAGRSIRQYR